VFFTKSDTELLLPGDTELIFSSKISVPS